MDKIQQLHFNEIGAGYIPEESKKAAAIHATITEDLMGRFAEWVGKEGWIYFRGSGKWRRSPEASTTSELIQLFKETL